MPPINMKIIYYCNKKVKTLHVLEVDMISIKKNHWLDVFSTKDVFFIGRVLNDRLCDCLYHLKRPRFKFLLIQFFALRLQCG